MTDKKHNHIGVREYIRALRLPFLSASVLPFLFGSLIDKQTFKFLPFIFGLGSVVFTHLGANLINDYSDSKSGADWKDRRFYGFFGGSKLIQEGLLPEKFYLNLAIIFFLLGSICVLVLSFIFQIASVILYYLLILFLGFSYSHKPLQFSYHRLGEFIIFILFGPALVMGAQFIQAQIFPTFKGFMLSAPFGILTTAILFSNEIPDLPEDIKSRKFTWASLTGQKKAFILYALLMVLAFAFIAIDVSLGYLSLLAFISFIFIFLAVKAIKTLKQDYYRKNKLVESSKLTIAVHNFVSIILILALLL